VAAVRVLELDARRGLIKLVPEDVEDLYYLALIVRKGDVVRAWTKRSVKVDRGFRVERGERVRVYLGVRVEGVEFSEFANRLRVRGVVVEAPEHLHARGSHHTILVEPGKEVVIQKEELLKFELDLLKKCSKPKGRALVVSVGDDHSVIGVLGASGMTILAEIRNRQARRPEDHSLKAAYEDYLSEVVAHLRRVLSRQEATVVVVLCPSLLKKWVEEALDKARVRREAEVRVIMVSEGGLAGLYEFLRGREALKVARHSSAVYERLQVDEVFRRLVSEPGRVLVGMEEVRSGSLYGAVDRLVVLDSLIRTLPDNEELMGVVRRVEESGGRVVIVSERSEAGAKLKSLGGIAALTRYELKNSVLH